MTNVGILPSQQNQRAVELYSTSKAYCDGERSSNTVLKDILIMEKALEHC